MPTEPDMKLPPRRNWLRILLVASLMLNLLFIGLMIGAAWRFGGPGAAHRPPPSFGAALFRELPRSERKAFRTDMNARPIARMAGRREEATRLAEALRATPFDAVAVLQVLSDQAEQRALWQSTVQAAWIIQVESMDASERAAYADRLQNAISRKRSDRKRRKDKED